MGVQRIISQYCTQCSRPLIISSGWAADGLLLIDVMYDKTFLIEVNITVNELNVKDPTGQYLNLGPCRIIKDPEPNGKYIHAWLIPVVDIRCYGKMAPL